MEAETRSSVGGRRAACLLAVFALASSPVLAAKSELPKTQGWIEAKTENFTVYSSAGEGRTRKIARQLERFRLALGRLTRGMKLDSQVPTSMFVFKSDASYVPYKRAADGKPMNVSGYFLPRPFGNTITLDASAESNPMRIVYHEYFHSVMNNSLGSLPVWLNEGLAEYFSTFKDRDGSTILEVGHPIEQHLAYLAERGTISWRDVFSTTTDSSTYNEGTRQGSFYAQSWLLAHYLNADEKRSKQLGAYLTLLRGGRDEDQAFVEAFGMDKAAMGPLVDKYRESGSGYIWWDSGEEHGEVDIRVRELEPAEVLYRLGDLLAQSGQREAAIAHLTAAGEAGWSAAAIQAALGAAAVYAEDHAGAESVLRKAIEFPDAPAEPYALLGDLILQRFFDSAEAGRPSRQTPGPVLEARRLYEEGLRRQPGNFSILVSYARTCLFGGEESSRGAQAIEQAKSVRPLDLDMLQVQAALIARSGDVRRAFEIVEREIAPRDRKRVGEATSLVTNAAVTTAVERLEGEDRKGAQEILASTLPHLQDEKLRGRVRQLNDVVAAGGSVVLQTEKNETGTAPSPMQQAVTAYNEGVGLTRSKRYDEALVKFDGVAAACPEEQLCASARQQAQELRKLIEHNRFVEKYNAAIERANAEDRKAAVQILRELEATVEDPEKLADIQRLLRQLGARVAKPRD